MTKRKEEKPPVIQVGADQALQASKAAGRAREIAFWLSLNDHDRELVPDPRKFP